MFTGTSLMTFVGSSWYATHFVPFTNGSLMLQVLFVSALSYICVQKKGADVLSTPTHIIKNIPQKINLLIFLLLGETLRSLVRLSFLVSRCKYKTNSCTIGENFCQKMSYKLYNFVLFFWWFVYFFSVKCRSNVHNSCSWLMRNILLISVIYLFSTICFLMGIWCLFF